MRKHITTAAIAASGLALMASTADAASTRATVIRVVDGQTVRVDADGAARNVRLLGVDAPALGDCFSTEAATELRRLLPRGASVRLSTDGGRRGAYVKRGRKLVNKAMLAGGFAIADRPDGLRKGGRLIAAQERAEAAGRGLWSECAEEQDEPAVTAPGTAPTPAAIARDQLTAELAGRVLRHFGNTSGGCINGCVQSEEALEYCSNGDFSYDFQFAESAGGTVDQQHDEGTWKVRDAVVEADGTLTGKIDVTIERGTAIERGEVTPGTVESQEIAITPDGATFLGGERWFRVASERCA